MKTFLLLLILASLFGSSIQTISRTNHYAREAAKAYEQQDYTYAIAAYEYLLNELKVQDDQIRLNLAHSYYRAHGLEKAKEQYQLLTGHQSQRIRGLATLQLGNVDVLQKKYKKAINLYRNALIADPGNESARYNYELLKKYLEKHPELLQEEDEEETPLSDNQAEADSLPAPPEPSEKGMEQETPMPKKSPDAGGTEQEETDTKEQADNGTQEGKRGSGKQQDLQQDTENGGDREKEQTSGTEAGDTLGQNPDNSTGSNLEQPGSSEAISEQDQRAQTQRTRLQQVNLSPEKAQMLLDAMRNAELQYIQQLPKKATRKPDRTKPDW